MNFRSSLLFFCLLALAMAPALAAEPGRGSEARLRASVAAALKEQRLAGMAWSLVSDGGTRPISRPRPRCRSRCGQQGSSRQRRRTWHGSPVS